MRFHTVFVLGLLTSKLSYTNGDTSPVNYSRFDNITLNLPQQSAGQVSLYSLLWTFVSQETVQSADERSHLVKQINFGKLPECLCFHIQRTGLLAVHLYFGIFGIMTKLYSFRFLQRPRGIQKARLC